MRRRWARRFPGEIAEAAGPSRRASDAGRSPHASRRAGEALVVRPGHPQRLGRRFLSVGLEWSSPSKSARGARKQSKPPSDSARIRGVVEGQPAQRWVVRRDGASSSQHRTTLPEFAVCSMAQSTACVRPALKVSQRRRTRGATRQRGKPTNDDVVASGIPNSIPERLGEGN